MKKFVILLFSCLLLTGCNNENRLRAVELGSPCYVMKTLDGLFFSQGDDLFLISGTEVWEGSDSQVFVYQVSADRMVLSQTLEHCCSMTAFCETEQSVYFATIARTASDGWTLYAYDKDAQSITRCAHFQEKGCYALCWDGNDTVYAASSSPSALYSYSISAGRSILISNEITSQPYIRSMEYFGGNCYLGIGSQAELISIEPKSGAIHHLLPQAYDAESFVYGLRAFNGKLYVSLSPSSTILEYDPAERVFSEIQSYCDVAYSNITEEYSSGANLLGSLLVKGAAGDTISLSLPYKSAALWNSAVYGLTISGIVEKHAGNAAAVSHDLCEYLERSYVIPTEFLAYDGNLYIPERRFQSIFRDGKTVTHLVSTEPQASTVTADGVYTANYTRADVWFYPFSVLADPDTDLNDPRYKIADIEHQCRPSQMEITPDDRYLVIGTGPEYGSFGGAVSVYDLQERSLLYTHENPIAGHRVQSLKCSTARPGTVWLGTNPYGENTYPAHLDEPSHLLLWDIAAETALLDLIPDASMQKIASIEECGNTVICVTQDAHLHAFDVTTGNEIAENSSNGIYELLLRQDGTLLGINESSVFRIDPATLRAEPLIQNFEQLVRLREDVITGKLYVFDRTNLIYLEEPIA